VFFCDDADAVDLSTIGPILEKNKMFPQGANIEFATVKSGSQIRMRVWERGAGITEACGSGACAVLVAAARNNFTARKAEVILDGGSLNIEWVDNGSVIMTGPTTVSFRGEISF
jgi:diaminopimelate epimerase